MSGCEGTLHKDYRFQPLEQSLGWGEFYARLRGTDASSDEDGSHRGSPYELILAFTASSKAKGCELFLEKVSLVSNQGRSVALRTTDARALFKEESNGGVMAYFSFKEIDLEYVPHELSVSYHAPRDCPAIDNPMSLQAVFKTDYEESSITFWDALMGV